MMIRTAASLIFWVRDFVMDFILTEYVTMHTHSLALFVMYGIIFIRYYRGGRNRVIKAEEPTISKSYFSKRNESQTPFSVVTSKPRSSISHDKQDVADADASLSRSHSTISISSFESKEIGFDFDDALSRLESDSSLRLQSTIAERRRFLLACHGNITYTTKRLHHYLEWNKQHIETKEENSIRISPTRDRDFDVWVESSLTAMKLRGEVENIVLPRMIRSQFTNSEDSKFSDLDGCRTFCIRPGLMDLKLAKSSTYTLAVAIYLDRSLDREKLEKVTMCLDVRAGKGWPNTHVLRLIPFIRDSIHLILPLFPERLHKALVYPVPSAFRYIWKMIFKYMDPETARRVCILEGVCKIEAPPPMELLRGHFGEEELDQLEASRLNSFKC